MGSSQASIELDLHGVSRYDRGEPLPDGMFRREGQTFLREGKISRILWVRTPVIGQIEIFPTDVTEDGIRAQRELVPAGSGEDRFGEGAHDASEP